MRKITWIITSAVLVVLILLLYNIVSADTTNSIPVQPALDEAPAARHFDIKKCVVKTNSADTPYLFHPAMYLDSANISRLQFIMADLQSLDTLTNDPNFNRRTLSGVLTSYLSVRTQLESYQPDSLLRLLQWAEQFQYAALIDPKSRIFYNSVYGFWFTFIADKLTSFSNQQPSLKYDFKFKYLVTRCKEQNYTMGIKVTSWEKFVENILYSNWGHLINATWNQTTWFMKIAFLLAGGIFLMGLYNLFKLILNRLIIKK